MESDNKISEIKGRESPTTIRDKVFLSIPSKQGGTYNAVKLS